MQQRVLALAAQFTEVNEAIRRLVEPCTKAEWHTRYAVGDWSPGVTVHHIANGYDQEGWVAALIAAILAGHALPAHPAEQHPEQDYNERYVRDFAAYTKAETLALLRHNEAAASALMVALDDDDLERSVPVDSRSVSVRRVIEQILIHHAQEHLSSLRATLGRA
jgi:hypothetical protein